MKRKQMATVLQKPIIILALLLVNSMLFPQNNHNNLTPWCIKPYYGKQYDKELDHNYSCIGLEAFFFLSQSINVGAFVNGGTFKYSMTFYEDNNFILYDGECRDLFWKYGINSEFHPIPLLFPNFRIIDVYLDGHIGLFIFTSDYWPTKYKFLYGMGIGLALNLSKHFGLFYERNYDNVNTTLQKNNKEKIKAMNRFGLNFHF
jgi:hypothetical protein